MIIISDAYSVHLLHLKHDERFAAANPKAISHTGEMAYLVTGIPSANNWHE